MKRRKRKSRQPGRIVIVDWEDAHNSDGWVDVDQLTGELPVARSIGWVILESKKSITIAPSVMFDTGIKGILDRVADEITIPRGCIRRIVDVRAK